MGFVLLNAENQHRRYPTTFWIPEKEARETIDVGDYVKLVFRGDEWKKDRRGERMWVKVTELRPDGKYRGTLSNEPVLLEGLHEGDLVGFGPEHVIQIESSTSLLTKAAIGGALVVGGAFVAYRLLKSQPATQQATSGTPPAGYLVIP